MSLPLRDMARSGLLLTAFAVAGALLVGLIWQATAERIAENARQAVLRQIDELVPPDARDNDPYHDMVEIADWRLDPRGPTPVYRAFLDGEPVAALYAATAPNGYGGPIRLLVAVCPNGVLIGVRVVSHRETPGLGDYIDRARSDWIDQFDGRSLDAPPEYFWRPRREGGAFDHATGATITARAVVDAVHHVLDYHRARGSRLLFPDGPRMGQP